MSPNSINPLNLSNRTIPSTIARDLFCNMASPTETLEASQSSESSENDWTAIDFRRVGNDLGLQSSRTSQRLNQIDRVRANGVGDHVALPQLVVCGDQSAGKSSVLEGISGIPFPREDGLCTRFATEIVMRHSQQENRMTATITPHSAREDGDKSTPGFISHRVP